MDKVQRTTSVEVYKQLVEGGVLPPMRRAVYKELYKHGPLTRNQVADTIGMVRNDCSTRLRELRVEGRVREVGEIKCPITGNEVLLYDVTASLGRTVSHNGKGKRKVTVEITKCDDCMALQEDRDDNDEVVGVSCWLNKDVEPTQGGRPRECPLSKKSITLKGG